MYQPRHFAPPDAAGARALVRAHPLATLVWTDAGGALAADPVPMLLLDDGGPQGRLLAHVARANPLWQQAAGRPVLAQFMGPQAYVSPGWYPGKAVDGKVVPTWNYALVQAHGLLQVHDDAAWLHGLVRRLTQTHEAAMPRPWQVEDAPADYIDRMLGAIVGIELQIDRLDAKFKLSQNQPEPNRAGVLDGLAQRDAPGDAALRSLMQQVLSPVKRG
jgi:transcriptional regulator